MKQNVLVDLDGVIRDFIRGLQNTYQKYFPDHQIRFVNSRELKTFFPIGNKIDDFIREYQREISFNSPAYEGAVESLYFWKNRFNITIVTSQEQWAVQDTLDWISEYKLPVSDIVISSQKETVPGIALLDDFIDNLEQFNRSGRLGICLEQPWNVDWPGLKVKTVDDFFKLINNK